LLIEFPGVIGTADAIVFDHAIGQSRTTMRAAFGNESEAAVFRAEQGETLAEDFHGDDREIGVFPEFGRGCNGMPEASHVVAHRRTRPDAGQPLITFGNLVVRGARHCRHTWHRRLLKRS
jgi:hypothetical protein